MTTPASATVVAASAVLLRFVRSRTPWLGGSTARLVGVLVAGIRGLGAVGRRRAAVRGWLGMLAVGGRLMVLGRVATLGSLLVGMRCVVGVVVLGV